MSRLIFLAILALMLVTPLPATAQDAPVAALLDCRQIADPERRLACFDKLADEYQSGPGQTRKPEAAEADGPGAVDERVAGESAAADDAESPEETQDPAPDAAAAGAEAGMVSGDRDAAPEPARPERVVSADDLSLPHRGRIEAFTANRRGDFRFRIVEGIVFERAGGPGVPSSDLTGAEVTLSKNFLGQWRARVEGHSRELWVSPVRR